MRIAAIGDVCGQPGLLTLEKNLRLLRRQEGVHFIVVNGKMPLCGVSPPSRPGGFLMPEPM